jgi:hypothetical protein
MSLTIKVISKKSLFLIIGNVVKHCSSRFHQILVFAIFSGLVSRIRLSFYQTPLHTCFESLCIASHGLDYGNAEESSKSNYCYPYG